MDLFEFMSRYLWVVAIASSGIHVAMFKARSLCHVRENPELAEGYATLLRGCLLWTNIPWVVMGIGCTVGGVPTVWYYFRPQDGNPYVMTWLISVIGLWIAGTYWIMFRGGAEMLVKHPGLYNLRTSSPMIVKVFWLLSLAGGVCGLVIVWILDIPLPPMR